MKIDKESDTRTHWKNLFDYKYLGAQDFEEDKDLILTVKEFYAEEVESERGKEDCIICSFEEEVKPMVINKLNFKSLSKVYKTTYAEDFIGQKIQLFIKKNQRIFGKLLDVIRIREVKPKKQKKPVLKKTELVNAVNELNKSGNLEKVKQHRTITPAQEKKIKELAKTEK